MLLAIQGSFRFIPATLHETPKNNNKDLMIEEGLSSIHPKKSNEGKVKESRNAKLFSFGNRSPHNMTNKDNESYKSSNDAAYGPLSKAKNSLSPFQVTQNQEFSDQHLLEFEKLERAMANQAASDEGKDYNNKNRKVVHLPILDS